MEKFYLVLANGIGKDKKPYSKACEVKVYGDSEYCDLKNPLYLEEKKPVGHKFKVELTVKAGA